MSDDVTSVAALITELAAASAGTAEDLRRLAGLLGERVGPAALDRGVDLALLDALDTLFARGWAPRDVAEIARRRVGVASVPLVLDLLAADAERRPRGWAVELDGLDAVVWWDRAGSLAGQWRSLRGRTAADVLRSALGLVHALRTLPSLPRSPGEAGRAGGADGAEWDGDGADGVDPKILARVRALLAKAESTAFAEEAEALSAKAQELMARHALEQAAVTAERPAGGARGRRLWLDPPYTAAKSSLVAQVAEANRCRAVSLEQLDLVTVVGHPADLDVVELLVTSLLVQAGRAMLAAGPAAGRSGSRTRSFRHAFLLAYAARIGERLREAAREAEDRARESVGAALVPVLTARREAVERTVGELFPTVTTRRFSAGNAAGWHAGRAAADAASLRPDRDAIGG